MSLLVFHEVFVQLKDQAYENTYMVAAETNRELAGYTLDELLSFLPEAFGLKAVGERMVICVLEDIVRESMSYVPPPFKHAVSNFFISFN